MKGGWVNPSPWRGESRAGIWWLVVGLLLVDLGRVVGATSNSAVSSLQRTLVIACAVVVGVAAVAARRRRWMVVAGVIALAGLLGLVEWCSRALPDSGGTLFVTGAVFVGWLLGAFAAGAFDRRHGRTPERVRTDAFGEAGAFGVLAALVFGAGVSALVDGRLFGASLLAFVAESHRFTGDWFDPVPALLARPALARHLLEWGLVVPLAMPLAFKGPVWRAVVGTLVLMLVAVAGWSSGFDGLSVSVCLAAFIYPWPRIVRFLARREQPSEVVARAADEQVLAAAPADRAATRDVLRMVAVVGCMAVLGRVLLWEFDEWRGAGEAVSSGQAAPEGVLESRR